MRTLLIWLNEHPHEYMRISILWMFASVLSPWRIRMLLALFVVNGLLIFYDKKYREE